MTSPSYRATKSGLAAEAHSKILSKYDPDLAAESLEWVRAVTGDNISTSGDPDNFWEVLKDGQTLCRLANAMKTGSVKKIVQSTMAFKCMENINAFLTAASQMGVPTVELFQTVDLWERQNLNAVVVCLHSLGRKGASHNVASIGPKESEKNVRSFTESQLNAGKGVIGLQMGSNKGASQAGMNIGNTRHM